MSCVTMRMNWRRALKLNGAVDTTDETFHYPYAPGVSTLVSSFQPVGEGSVIRSVHITRKQTKKEKLTKQLPLEKESHARTYQSRSYNNIH